MIRLALIALALALLTTGRPGFAQEQPDTATSFAVRFREAGDRIQAEHVERAALNRRAGEFGVRLLANNLKVAGLTGTIVFADQFSLDPDTNAVNASGNVRIEVWEGGIVLSRVSADRATIGEPQ
jgi:hypothetical protein